MRYTICLALLVALLMPIHIHAHSGYMYESGEYSLTYDLCHFDVPEIVIDFLDAIDLSTNDLLTIVGTHAGAKSEMTYEQKISAMIKTGQLGCSNWLLSSELRKILLC